MSRKNTSLLICGSPRSHWAGFGQK